MTIYFLLWIQLTQIIVVIVDLIVSEMKLVRNRVVCKFYYET